MRRVTWLVILLVCPALGQASAQRGGSVLVAGVGDAESGAFVVDAEVSVRGLGLSARSDSMSQARIQGIPRGVYTVEARRIGYEAVSAQVKFSGRDSVEVVLLMQPSNQELPTVVVEDSAPSVWLKEFESRRKKHIGGYFVTEKQLRKHLGGNIWDIALAEIPGVRQDAGGGFYSTRGPNSWSHGLCDIAIFLDGVRLTDAGPDIVSIELLGGVEYYSPGFVPVQYQVSDPLGGRGSAACGVMLLWTRP